MTEHYSGERSLVGEGNQEFCADMPSATHAPPLEGAVKASAAFDRSRKGTPSTRRNPS